MKDEQMMSDLSMLKSDFKAGFSDRVLSRLRAAKEDRVVRMWSRTASIVAAASIALVMLFTYTTYGSISKDSLSGLDDFSSVELSEGLNTYAVYNE